MIGRSTLRSSIIFFVIKSRGEKWFSSISPLMSRLHNILMKPLSKIKFAYLRDKLGLVEIGPLVEREEMTSSVGREH
jgi:hypothetical protein